LVEILGADINGVDYEGATFSNIATSNRHLNIVRFLVTILGADVNKAIKPSMAAILAKHGGIVRSLVKTVAKT
jgi:ankyrin repeat protein